MGSKERFRVVPALCFLVGLPVWSGCGELGGSGGKVKPAAEAHDLKGEHAIYPAGGPESPEYKKMLAKKKAEEKKSAP